MFSNILEDAIFEVRRRWKVRLLLPLILIAVGLLVVGVIVGIGWLASDRARPPQVNSEDIPMGSYAAGNIEVFNCIYTGPDECTEYDRSREWIAEASAGTLTYAPIEGDSNAPGQDAGGGLLSVTDFQSLTDEEWHSLAAGATLEGEANPGTVTENSVKTEGFDPERLSADASFTLPEGSDSAGRTGTITFSLKDSGVVMEKIIYSESE